MVKAVVEEAGYISLKLRYDTRVDIAPNQAGLLMGVTNTLAAVSSSASVLVSGWIQDLSGGWDAVFLTAAGVSVFGAIIYASLAGVEREFD